ncbi:hypothetical protein KKE06_04495 [Candidatus Micrarchaeota archaeon]|nr:hypothetical protein [Candidatus Micrarchaeota archaeon]MBU1930266.1 hypothetical protein [Candidatus Micrarchaeota archaeon]
MKTILVLLIFVLSFGMVFAVMDYSTLEYIPNPDDPLVKCDQQCYTIFSGQVQQLAEESEEAWYRTYYCRYHYGHDGDYVEGITDPNEYCGSLSASAMEAIYARMDEQSRIAGEMSEAQSDAAYEAFNACQDEEWDCRIAYEAISDIGCSYDYTCEWNDPPSVQNVCEKLGITEQGGPIYACVGIDLGPEPEVCYDDKDNDADGLIDCEDSDCAASIHCTEFEICNDEIDNDNDGLIDCREDPDCEGDIVCEMPESICDDNEDNDGDGVKDCEDPDCQIWDEHCQETEDCTDGMDNDFDNKPDCEDEDCWEHLACIETYCADEIDNDNDGFIDCKDGDCREDPNCEIVISISTSSDTIIADGKSEMEIEIEVFEAGEPVNNEEVIVWVRPDNLEWTDFVDDPVPNSGLLGNGKFNSRFQPKTVHEKIQAQEIEFEEMHAKIFARHKRTNATVEKDITILSPRLARIIVLEAIQSIRNVAMVAGKKTVVMVGIKANESTFFEENENFTPFLELEIEGSSFAPKSKVKIKLTEESEEDWIVRNRNPEDHLEFFGFNSADAATNKWVFYEFYVDPQDTQYKGEYNFKARILLEQPNASTGQPETIVAHENSQPYDAYPSSVMVIKIVPIGIGTWRDDFCDYCIKEKEENFTAPTMQDAINVSRRIAYEMGYTEAALDLYEFNCAYANFTQVGAGFNFDGMVNPQKINQILTKDDSPMRYVCKQGFENLFSEQQLQQMQADSPITRRNGKTGKQVYLDMVKESKDYFKAVMPIAEENIFFHTAQKPFENKLSGKTTSLLRVLWALRDITSGRRWNRLYTDDWIYENLFLEPGEEDLRVHQMKGYDRVVGFVPTASSQTSDFDFGDALGVMNNMVNRYGVLVDLENASGPVMTHEILHTYCAIDEYLNWVMRRVTDFSTSVACSEGALSINDNKGTDNQGTPVKDGFWVEKRTFQGTPENPKYSIMGKQPHDEYNKWITHDLYHGVGVKIGSFPSDLEDAHGLDD